MSKNVTLPEAIRNHNKYDKNNSETKGWKIPSYKLPILYALHKTQNLKEIKRKIQVRRTTSKIVTRNIAPTNQNPHEHLFNYDEPRKIIEQPPVKNLPMLFSIWEKQETFDGNLKNTFNLREGNCCRI